MYSILWDYGVGIAITWVFSIKPSATENDYR